ncbi:ComF family protein [Candidatus Saccharibacteria bacterium]|nr:ComF family protein [Candidatus Saccharibacteria bacterium]
MLGKREGLLATLIHDFKYNSVRAIGGKLAEMMASRLPDLPKDTIIVPLPTATHHIRERGFDHTLFVVKRIAKIKHINVQRLFVRTANTVQVGANKSTRLAQAEHAFKINPKITVNTNATYILFDDVWTTGASMKSALKKLRKAGARNIIIALLATSSLD